MIIPSDVSHAFIRCLLNEFPLFRSFLILPWIFDDKRFLRFVSVMVRFPTRRRSANNHRLLFNILSKNKSFDLTISGDFHITLAVWLLNRRIEAELLVVHQEIAEHNTSKFESVLVDVERGGSRAARSVELPQAHHRSTEGKPKDEPPVLRTKNLPNVSGQVQPCWSLPIFDGIALQLSSHEDVSPVGDSCIRLFVDSILVTLTLSMACRNTNIHLPFDRGSIQIDAGSLVDPPVRCNMHAMFINPRRETLHKVLKPFQYESFLSTPRPPGPPTAFLVLRCISFLTQIKNSLCQFVKSWDMSKDCVSEVWNIDPKARKEFLFQRIIDLLSVFGGVFEAARVEGPRCLLKRRCKGGARWWRGCWLRYRSRSCNKVQDSCPNVYIASLRNNIATLSDHKL